MQATQIDRNEEIRQLAYKIWQESGCPDGADVQHWLQAQEIWLETHAPKKRRAIPSKARKPSKNVATKREL